MNPKTYEPIRTTAKSVVKILNNHFVTNKVVPEPFAITHGFRVWTRGDGARYKDFDRIDIRYIEREFELMVAKGKFAVPLDAVIPKYDIFLQSWDIIKTLSGAKVIDPISGEFGSSSYRPAIQYKNVIFIKNQWSIEYASLSILRNKSIWRQLKRAA